MKTFEGMLHPLTIQFNIWSRCRNEQCGLDDVASWPIVSFGCPHQFGRFPREADITRAPELLSDHQPDAVIADKAYDADSFVELVQKREAEVLIPPLSCRKVLRRFSKRKYKQRNLYKHNPHATLMRTTRDENVAMGKWIGQKLNACEGRGRFLIAEHGVSAIDAPGKPFHDPEADAALFETLEKTVKQTEQRRIVRLPHHINDAAFAAATVSQFREIIR